MALVIAENQMPESAPDLRDVNSLPSGPAPRAYDTHLGADELLKQFLSDISDVARDAEALRCACASFAHCARTHAAAPQSAVLLQAEPVRALEPAVRLAAGGGQAAIPQGAKHVCVAVQSCAPTSS